MIILHPEPVAGAGPLVRLLADARRAIADHHAATFAALGFENRIVAGPPDDTRFGARLLRLAADARDAGASGLVVMGSGALPLATPELLRRLAVAAAGAPGRVLANNRWSADAVAIAGLDELLGTVGIEALPSDNGLPRFLAEAGWRVDDLRDATVGRRGPEGRAELHARPELLELDLATPADLLLLARDPGCPGRLRTSAAAAPLRVLAARLDAVAAVARNPRAELLIAGRTSAATLRRLELETACRVRALVEERGLKAGSLVGASGAPGGNGEHAEQESRPPASALGMLLDGHGPEALGSIVSRLADAALIDTRVLLAHRLGRDAAGWPPPADRFASDLLDWRAVRDPWLAALTRSAAEASVPIALGAHTLVGPGAALALGLASAAGPASASATASEVRP